LEAVGFGWQWKAVANLEREGDLGTGH